MARSPPAAAIIGVRADKHPPALIVDDHLVQIAVAGITQITGMIGLAGHKGMIVEIQTDHMSEGRQRIDPLLAPRAKQLQGRAVGKLGVVKLGDRRRVHYIAVFHLDRIGIRGRNLPVPRDVFVKFHMHQAVVFQLVHLAGLGFAGFQKPQRFGDWHLID